MVILDFGHADFIYNGIDTNVPWNGQLSCEYTVQKRRP